jgi:presenilin-like A22 family membrane protease
MTSEEAKFKISFVYLTPILASLLFGLGCAWLLKPPTGTSDPVLPPISPPVVPFPDDTVSGPFGNAIYFVILVAIGATMCYFLLKQKKVSVVKAFIFFAMTLVSAVLSGIYFFLLLTRINLYSTQLLCGLIFLTVVLFDLAIFKYHKIRNAAVLGLGGAFGVFLGFLIPLYSAIAILIFLAIYDVFAVYRGPVGKLAQSGLDQLNGLSYAFKGMQMGLGDLVFYAVLMSVMFFSFPNSIIPTIMSIVGICIGSLLTFLMLTKKEMFPGLPFPVAIGLTLGLITTLLI